MDMTALGALMQDQKERLHLSYRDMERRAKGAIKAKRFQQLVTEPLENVPPTETLMAIAHALDLPVSVVVDAALESVGLRRSTAPPSRWVTMAHRAEELPRQKRATLERQVETLLSMYDDDPDRDTE